MIARRVHGSQLFNTSLNHLGFSYLNRNISRGATSARRRTSSGAPKNRDTSLPNVVERPATKFVASWNHYIDVQTTKVLKSSKMHVLCMWDQQGEKERRPQKEEEPTDRQNRGAGTRGTCATDEQKHNTRRTENRTKGGPRQQTETNTEKEGAGNREGACAQDRNKQTNER